MSDGPLNPYAEKSYPFLDKWISAGVDDYEGLKRVVDSLIDAKPGTDDHRRLNAASDRLERLEKSMNILDSADGS